MNDLVLVVQKSTVGFLETNILSIEGKVAELLKQFKPDLYGGDADQAKKDRAFLNASKKALSSERIRIVRELMKPYEDFEQRCKAVEKNIDAASSALDEIVKEKEEQERQAKKEIIEQYWNTKGFGLVPLAQFFDQRWLNKTYKIEDISAEMDAFIKKTYEDIKAIEAIGEDAPIVKALYLSTLDLSRALAEGQRLKENREKAEKEKAERASREHQQEVVTNVHQLEKDVELAVKTLDAVAMAAEAFGEEPEPYITYVLKIKGLRADLIKLRKYMSDNNIAYEKLEEY